MQSGNRDQRVRMPRVPEIASFVSAVPWAAAGMSSRMVAIPAAKPSSLLGDLFGDNLREPSLTAKLSVQCTQE